MVPNKASISTKDELTKEQSANLIKTKDVKTTFNIYLSNREIEINLKETIEKKSNFVKKKKKKIVFANSVLQPSCSAIQSNIHTP